MSNDENTLFAGSNPSAPTSFYHIKKKAAGKLEGWSGR